MVDIESLQGGFSPRLDGKSDGSDEDAFVAAVRMNVEHGHH
ncbi:hypothetical protein AB0B83_20095 [Micromonospora sp. NPDC049060]